MHIEIFVKNTYALKEEKFIKEVVDLCKRHDFPFELYDKFFIQNKIHIQIVFRNTNEPREEKFVNELTDLCQRFGFALETSDKFDLADPEDSFNEYFDYLEKRDEN